MLRQVKDYDCFYAACFEVERPEPMHYMRHKRTGEVQAVGDHGAYLELAQSGWEITDEVPDGQPAATGGPAI